MFCIYCGRKLPEDAEFCYKCGKKTVKAENIEEEAIEEDIESETIEEENFEAEAIEEEVIEEEVIEEEVIEEEDIEEEATEEEDFEAEYIEEEDTEEEIAGQEIIGSQPEFTMRKGLKVWLWISFVINIIIVAFSLTTAFYSSEGFISFALQVVVTGSIALLLFCQRRFGFYGLCVCAVIIFIRNVMADANIVIALIGLVVSPLVTYLLMKDDWYHFD